MPVLVRSVMHALRAATAGLALALVGSTAAPAGAQPATGCATVEACRQAALEAEAAGDGERFHDLAWRVMQLGEQDDPTAMYLVARAQAASGRSSDALVMLGRLAEAGVATDAADLDVFSRVRARSGWADVDARARQASRRIERGALAAVVEPAAEAPPSPASAAPAVPARGGDATPPGAAPASAAPAPVGPTPPATRPAIAVPTAPTYGAALAADIALRLDGGVGAASGGFAYDAVSSRYLVGDREARKIVVVDEPSRRVADLVRGDSAGFRQLVAMEIDPRRGDLWVLSNGADGASDATGATLHKLQLIAGRPLGRIDAPETAGDVRFADLAVAADGTVFVIDADGRRLYRVAPKGTTLTPVLSLELPSPQAIALGEGDAAVYVAHAEGVSRVELGRRRAEPVTGAAVATGTATTGVWWHGGTLVVLLVDQSGTRSLQQWQLDRRGTRVLEIRPVDLALPSAPTPVAVTLSGSTLLVLSEGVPVVQRVRLGP